MDWLTLWLIPLFISTLRVSTPLILASMGGLVSERSGVINIALEGLMLVGAFSAAVVAYYANSPNLGLLAAMGAGIALAAVYALFVIEFKSDQIVAGTAINILALGIPPFFGKLLFDATGSTPGLSLENRFVWEPMLIAFIVVIAVHLWLKHTPSGLWVRFAGEHPEALASSGKSVRLIRWLSVLMSGLLAGLAGSSLSLFLASSYSREMTGGRGFMALAALIFGRWQPLPTLCACLFFGLTDALQIRLQGAEIAGAKIPVQFIQILPYVVTILVLAGFVAKTKPPKALGQQLAE